MRVSLRNIPQWGQSPQVPGYVIDGAATLNFENIFLPKVKLN